MLDSVIIFAQTQDASQVSPTGAIVIGSIVFAVALVVFNYFTRSGTIARATTKESVRQPVFILMTLIGIGTIGLNTIIPFFSMGDDTKMFIDCGLATILICSLLLTIWSASMSVADEIEGKTAMTLLSKPINRRQFVLGKYVGIMQSALIMIVIVGALFIAFTYAKFGYDQREASQEQPEMFVMTEGSSIPKLHPARYEVAIGVLPGLVLIAMEVAMMAAVSVAISTRMPMLVNISSCFAIFVLGHLTPVMVKHKTDIVFVPFVARLLATVVPGLDHFNMQAAISTDKNIPPDYIGYGFLYCSAVVAFMVMVAFFLFEDRDLA